MLLKTNGLKTESHPFDWMVSCLENVVHILKTDFVHFLDKTNYKQLGNGTQNTFYFDKTHKLFPDIGMDHQHHNMHSESDYNYIIRCVDRFKKLHRFDEIVFVMVRPLYRGKEDANRDLVIVLFDLLENMFGPKIKMHVFNITSRNNTCYKEDRVKSGLFIYELATAIVQGPCGMQYFDDEGQKKFVELITQ